MKTRVWIIGGTSGIGSAVAAELMSEGFMISATDENETNVVNINELGNHLRLGWDHIVYSAGVNKLAWAEDLSVVDMMHIMDVNVIGFMRLVSLIAKMRKRMHDKYPASITAISSDAATHAMRTSMPYCASKAALNMAVKCAARELAPLVRVNAVSPGIVEGTALTKYTDETIPKLRGWTDENAMKYEQSNIPMGRRADRREIALVVRDVICGPQYLTGSIIEVNGGR